ncbi:TerC/Alx family metal homeostasis membrane protein [Membranihabitans maritimus]|uniref:TerC/Alx family metal homeostasis membrane protein n=1 Tax=Membranihabitans maritimus TaxID=2904244 RepID=UPI001F009E47|nr:TerC/Alx family metal homeostasis membrane protein [Membranihabitans maritimus]
MSIFLYFSLLILVFIILDLFVINKSVIELKKARKKATIATAFWMSLGLSFSIIVYFGYNNHWFGLGNSVGLNTSGKIAMIDYITGFLLELSLSIDNIFVMILIFKYFKIPFYNQHKALIYGIIGAIIFRAILIYLGSYLLSKLPWFNYIFGAILLYSGINLWRKGDKDQDLNQNKIIKYLRKVLPVIKDPDNPHFITRIRGIWVVTPLFLTVIMIEFTDILFAFDSIPAIFGITKDPFIVFSSNIFAILGLRSLFLVLSSFIDRFHNIRYSLVFILIFIGIKICIEHIFEIPAMVSLIVVVMALAGGVITSIKRK